MALVRVPEHNLVLRDPQAVAAHLASIGIHYEYWEPSGPLDADASAEQVLAAYHQPILRLQQRGGYVSADVIDVSPATPGLEAMLARFNREHWHDEDEVRFIVEGRGLFHIRPAEGPLTAVEVEAGDLLSVPRDTWHWFDLCAERRIRAIRLFQNAAGWTPYYTGSGLERNYQPLCFNLSDIAPRRAG